MDVILKLFNLLTNFAASKSQSMSKQLATTVRKIVMFVIIALGSMALFCVGVSLLVTNLAEQINHQSGVSWNGSIILGSLLAFFSLITFLYFLSQKAWLKAASIPNEVKNVGPSPLEEALAILIKDIVTERQTKRESATIQKPE